MSRTWTPRVGVLGDAAGALAERVREAGGEPVPIQTAPPPAGFGPALAREWVADTAHIACATRDPAALLLGGASAHETAGLLLAALRLDLPAVVESAGPFALAASAAGIAPFPTGGDEGASPKLAVEMALSGRPRLPELMSGFALANALRAGLSAGVGPELLVHLAALAREAGEVGFPRMLRVLAPETPVLAGAPGDEGLLTALTGVLNDVPTVAGTSLKESMSKAPSEPFGESSRLSFVRGRTSGIEAVVVAPAGLEEVAGVCRLYGSEEEAVEAVAEGRVGEGEMIVAVGLGPRGGPGLLVPNGLGAALAEAGLDVPVLTDGLPPPGAGSASPWIPLFTPEAASGGVIGLLRDGDTLRFDLARGRIRTSASADDLSSREPFVPPGRPRFGYAARYARSALPALDGAGFA